jgi:hypothetical protein
MSCHMKMKNLSNACFPALLTEMIALRMLYFLFTLASHKTFLVVSLSVENWE